MSNFNFKDFRYYYKKHVSIITEGSIKITHKYILENSSEHK